MSWKLALATTAVLVVAVALARAAQGPDAGTATWDASRASGFAGYLLLSGSLIAGLSLSLRFRPAGIPLTWTLETHRALAALALAFVVVHVVGLLLDPVVSFSPLDGLVPFTSSFRPFQVGMGTASQWLLVVVLASTALYGHISYSTWRRLHTLAFPCWALALLHSITSGTDTAAPLAVTLYALTAAAVAALLAIRLAGIALRARGYGEVARRATSPASAPLTPAGPGSPGQRRLWYTGAEPTATEWPGFPADRDRP